MGRRAQVGSLGGWEGERVFGRVSGSVGPWVTGRLGGLAATRALVAPHLAGFFCLWKPKCCSSAENPSLLSPQLGSLALMLAGKTRVIREAATLWCSLPALESGASGGGGAKGKVPLLVCCTRSNVAALNIARALVQSDVVKEQFRSGLTRTVCLLPAVYVWPDSNRTCLQPTTLVNLT